MTEPLLTVAEAAAYLRVKPRTLYQWIWRRRIPFLKAGSAVRFRRAEIDDWLARRNRKETRLAPAKKSRRVMVLPGSSRREAPPPRLGNAGHGDRPLAATLDDIEREIREATLPRPVAVSAFAKRWLTEWVRQRRNLKGVKLTEQRWTQHIEPAIGAIDLVALTYADLRSLRARLDGKRLKPQSVHHILSDVRCLLRYAVDAGEIVQAPWRRDLMPRIPEQAPKRLTDAQMERVFRFARPKEALCIQLAVETGIRWNELRTLQWRHVLEDPWPRLLLENTKSGKVRRVPLTAGAREAIEELRKIAESVFVSPYRMVNPCSIAYRIRDRMPEENRVRWHWHQLRHYAGSRIMPGRILRAA